MTHSFSLPCPKCRRELRIRREWAGQRLQCKHCQHKFYTPADFASEWSLRETQGEADRPSVQVEELQSPHAETEGLREALASPPAPAGNPPDNALAQQLQAVRRDRDRFQQELQTVRAQLEDAGVHREQFRQLQEEHEVVRAQRDQLLAERPAQVHLREQTEAEVRELQRALAEATAAQQAVQERLTEDLERARELWQAEQQRYRHQEQQLTCLREEQARGVAERQRWQEERATEQHQFEQERVALQEEIECGRRHAAALEQERDHLVAQRDEVEAARQEDRDRWQAEVAQLRQALVESQEQRDRIDHDHQQVTTQIQTLETELRQLREKQARLHHELKTARAEATIERQRGQQERAAEQCMFQQERVALREEVERGRRHAVTLGQELDRLVAQRDEATATRQQDADRWQAEVAQLCQALAESQEQRDRADQGHQEATSQIQTLDTELRQLREETARLHRELETARAEITAEQQQWQEQRTAEQQRWQEQCTTEQHQFEQERVALQEEVERGRRHAAALEQERDRLVAQRDEATATRQQDADCWQAEVAQLRQALVDSQEQRDRADQDHREATTQIQTLDTELRQLRGETARLHHELETARAEVTAEQQRWQEQCTTEQHQFEQERMALQREIECGHRHAAALEQDRDRLVALQDEVEAARQADRDRWQAEVAQLRQALTDRQEQCHRADQDHREATTQIQTLDTELRQLREETARLHHELETARAERTAEQQRWQVWPNGYQLGAVSISAGPVKTFGPTGGVYEGSINDRLLCRTWCLWCSRPQDRGPEPPTAAGEPNDLSGDWKELAPAVAVTFDAALRLDPVAIRKTIEVTTAGATQILPRDLDWSLAGQSFWLYPEGLRSRTAAVGHAVFAWMEPPPGDRATPVSSIGFPETAVSQHAQAIAQARQQDAVSLEQALDLAATGRLRRTTLRGGAGMPSRKPGHSTAERTGAQLPMRTSICLGEPILEAIGLLSQPLVIVTGLVALGLVVFLLLR